MCECNELTVITGFLLIFNLVLFSTITNKWPFSVFFFVWLLQTKGNRHFSALSDGESVSFFACVVFTSFSIIAQGSAK